MTTLEEIAFLRLASRSESIDIDHLRRAYVYRRSGRTQRNIPRLLLKNQLASRELLENLCARAHKEVPEVNMDLKQPERLEEILHAIVKDPETDISGERIGLCLFRECVGIGGEAVIYRAKHLAFQRDVALKIILPNARRKTSSLTRLRREASAVAKLSHKSIASVFDFEVGGLLPYVAFEFVRGGTLLDRIERLGRLPAREVVEIGQKLAVGLHTAHAKGLLHRDVKPSNIMIGEDRQVKIIDFGFAKDLSVPGHITATGFIVGTPYYTAPEYGTDDTVDHRADLYSLGVTLFHALTGALPFESKSIVRLLAMHMQEPPPEVRKYFRAAPPVLAAIIEKLLQKRPEDRFQSGLELAKAFNHPEVLTEPVVVEEESDIESNFSSLNQIGLSALEAAEASLEPEDMTAALPQYDHIPEHLLTCLIDEPECPLEHLHGRVLDYPGAPSGHNGLRDDILTASSMTASAALDDLPQSGERFRKRRSKSNSNLNNNSKPFKNSRSKRSTTEVHDRRPVDRRKSDTRVFCSSCEIPIKKARKILGNVVCLNCVEKVDNHSLCTSCFSPIQTDRPNTQFRSRMYCHHCSKRVILFCSHCRIRFPLKDLARGRASELEGKPYCIKCSNKSQTGSGEHKEHKIEAPKPRKSRIGSGRFSGSRSGRQRPRSTSGRLKKRRRR